MISVLIPAFMEAERIGATVRAVRSLPYVVEVVVVDDASSDTTGEEAKRAGADRVLRLAVNGGKGAALREAFSNCNYNVILLIDADLGDSAREAEVLLRPVLCGEADMSIALFPPSPSRGGGSGRVVRLARAGIARLTGRTMQSPLSGQRALRREVLERCGGFAEGWGVEVALTVRALREGFRVVEVPTTMSHRVTGRDWRGVLHRARQYVGVARVLRLLSAERKSEEV